MPYFRREASVLLTLSSFLFLTGFVKPITVNLEDLPKADRWAALQNSDVAKKAKTAKDPLAKAAMYETVSDWENCAINAGKAPAKSAVKDWALLIQINCARQMADADLKAKQGKTAGALLSEAIKRTEAQNFDPYSKNLQERKQSAVLAARLSLCKWLDKHSQWKELRSELQKLAKLENYLSKNERAQMYFYSGNVMVADRQWGDALWQFQRARELNPDAAQIDSRVKAVLPMVPASVREQFEQKTKAENEKAVISANPSTEELDIANQADGYLVRNDPVAAVEALAKLIKKFPGGVNAKAAQDKIFSLFTGEIEKSKGPNGVSVAKKKIQDALLEFDSDRQQDWGNALFNMQAYNEAAPLLKKAAEQISASAKASKPYFLAARAYQLGNSYKEAKEVYATLIKNYPAAPEIVDAAIQLGLVNFNEGEASDAIAHLEVARSRKMTSQQDLISLFWLYQSYKLKNAQPGIEEKGNDLMKRFGLTYYGLIASQDLKKQLPQYEKSKTKTAKVYFSDSETHALERARALMNAGLLNAAGDELGIFLSRPLSVPEELYIANYYAQALHYPKAFALLNNAADEDPDKRNDFVVHLIFPKEYWDLVSDDKKRSDVDPLLLLSVMKQESAFDKQAVSRSGALGLMQMIPPTAEEVKQELNSSADIPKDLTDPGTNVRFCAHYLAHLLKKYNGSVPLALAAYNAGPTRITQFVNARGGNLKDTWVDELPWAETSFYVKSILKNYVEYRMLYGGMTTLPTPPWSK